MPLAQLGHKDPKVLRVLKGLKVTLELRAQPEHQDLSDLADRLVHKVFPVYKA